MYHRVLTQEEAVSAREEPGMYVTPETLEANIEWLKDFGELVSLGDWIRMRQNNSALPTRSIAITFDDGWQDNYRHAFPILQRHNVPAVIFAVTGYVGTQKLFWPNRLAAQLRYLDDAEEWPASFSWLERVSDVAPCQLTTPHALSELIHACKVYSDEEMHNFLDISEKALNAEVSQRSMLNWDELREMQSSGLIEIGSHTISHCRLRTGVPEFEIENEVIQSKMQLQDQLGSDINLFCYPNGDTSKYACEQVEKHYSAAVLTESGINSPNVNSHKLCRIGYHEDIANNKDYFLARLSGWV